MTARTRVALVLFCAAVAPGIARAQSAAEPRVTIHGFLTQGIAVASEPILGVPEKPTADYRTVALQVRFAVAENGALVVQLSHRRLGESPMMDWEKDAELDWAFYRQRLGPLTLRLGRFPAPRGIYNEVRDVGTVLPFFRAPFAVYYDGGESVDGIGLGHEFAVGEWSFETRAYAGGTENKAIFFLPEGALFLAGRSEVTVGGQIWANTPFRGLRFGLAAMREQEATARAMGRPHADRQTWHGSLDADFDRYLVRIEHVRAHASTSAASTYYAHARFKATERLHLVSEFARVDFELEAPVAQPKYMLIRDAALGVNFAANPNLVLKLEVHSDRGYAFDRFVDPAGPPITGTGVIGSVSVSF